MVDFIVCSTGCRVPVGIVTSDMSVHGKLTATWSVLEVVDPAAALVMSVEYENEMGLFAQIALTDARQLSDGELVNGLILVARMIQAIRLVLPRGWDYYAIPPNGPLGIWYDGPTKGMEGAE